MIFLCQTIQDTYVRCYSDQILGQWRFELSKFDRIPYNDNIECDPKFQSNEVKYIRLKHPNIAIDENGNIGTWTMVYIQAVEISVGGIEYSFYLNFSNDIPNNITTSYCNESQSRNSWAKHEGVSRQLQACMRAQNVKPDIGMNATINVDPYIEKTIKFRKQKYPMQNPNPQRLQKIYLVSEKIDQVELNFDWRNVSGKQYVPTAMNQSWPSCGSCYACATAYMMMSRIMIQNNTPNYFVGDKMLSIQHLVDCNTYSQGCLGGFVEHVGKFAEEFGVLDLQNYGPYTASKQDCKTGKYIAGQRYFFQNTKLLGGYLGAVTSVTQILHELRTHGPIAVSVDDNDLFDQLDPYGNEIAINNSGDNRHYFHNEVNHEVLLVGWETKEIEIESKMYNKSFWIIQNSFGKKWGVDENGEKKGAIKVAMGINAYGVESQPKVTYWRPEGNVNWGQGQKDELCSEKKLMTIVVYLEVAILVVFAIVGVLTVLLVYKKKIQPRQ